LTTVFIWIDFSHFFLFLLLNYLGGELVRKKKIFFLNMKIRNNNNCSNSICVLKI
jgi:hypothetical protein